MLDCELALHCVKGEGFDVMKSGDARVALIGFPSVGKVYQTDCSCTFKLFCSMPFIPPELENEKQLQLGRHAIHG